MKKLGKNQIRLIRIIVSVVWYAVLFALDKTIGLSQYLSLGLYLGLYVFIGYDVLWRAMRNIVHGQIFDENFLMCIATIGAFGIGENPEAAAVMMFYQVGELFQDYAVGKSRKSISGLMDIRPDIAVVLKDGIETEMMPEDVQIGDILIVKVGERIPIDGVVVSGASNLDTSALTGESVPRACVVGDEVLSGSINTSGVLHIRAEKEYVNSTVAKILDMVENASNKKAKAENFISRFSKYYTPFVCVAAVFVAVIPPIFDNNWLDWLSRALTFLVISCPCALVISVPMSFFGGLGAASKKGILFKGASYLELINKAKIYVFDKTGTLTKGSFDVKKVIPENNREKILKVAAVAEKGSLHPIAKSILALAGDVDNSGYDISESVGRGVVAVKDGDKILCGNERLMIENNIALIPVDEVGSVIHVAENGEYLGCIVIADTVRDDAKQLISELKNEGCRTIMLTGDNDKYAKAVAEEVGIDSYKANLLPADKVVEMEAIMESKSKKERVIFVGDGVNDSPVLMRADLGISMGEMGSDSAVEASDMVLMHDTLESIQEAKKISRKTIKLVYENIVFILVVKAVILILGACGIANMWLAVFADVGVAVLATINSMRALKSPKKLKVQKK